MIAYLTDVEGRWDKLASFATGNPAVTLDGDRLAISPGWTFVFGGDAIDRGPHGRRIVAALLQVKRRQPGQVVLLAGNRDINKLRLARELRGHPPARAPANVATGPRATLLRWIFDNTMGAREAFAHRRAELAAERGRRQLAAAPGESRLGLDRGRRQLARVGDGDGDTNGADTAEEAGATGDLEDEGDTGSDEAVVASYLDDLGPRGALREYLRLCQLAWREGRTLFVHGGVTDDNLGVVPARRASWAEDHATDVDTWVGALNRFYAEQMTAFCDEDPARHEEPGWAAIVAYQAPLPGSRVNQRSVVYGRPSDDAGNPFLPSRATVSALRRDGVARIVVGHTPTGDCPTVLRDGEGFEVILADNSYGRVEAGSMILIEPDRVHVRSEILLDDGERAEVRFELGHRRADDALLGLRDAATGHLVKARLARGDYVLFRALGGYRMEQLAEEPSQTARRRLVSPWPAGAPRTTAPP